MELQRIVDGELNHGRRAELLRSLEPHSSQWRELALLLLEDQELSKQIRSELPIDVSSRASDSLSAWPRCVIPVSLDSDALATAGSRKSSLGYRLLAVCTIFSVGLGSGFLFKAIAPDAASFPQALSGAKPGLPKDFAGDSTEVRLADPNSSSGGSFDYVSPWRVRVENASDRAIEIPLVDAREIDPQLILANNAIEIAKFNQQLKRRGYELEAKPTMYSGALEDGRKIMVPIHKVSLRPYGL